MRTIKGLLTKAFTKLPFSHIRVWVDPDNNKAPILDLKSVRNYSDYWSMKYFKCKIVVKTISPITERNAYSDLRKHFVNEFGYF